MPTARRSSIALFTSPDTACVDAINDLLGANDKTPYYYKCLRLQGKAWVMQEQYSDAIKAYDEILRFVTSEEDPLTYYTAMVEAGTAFMSQKTEKEIKK
ncbi:MAG: hypothetical protein IH986_18140, partial [Planctomycetes bacterium]|nr:hypothetical protein [Planctomycetota bacterium]